ncbi:Fc.00g090130.m01.CDS01 [Cosmosporella sp. VM-42]
MSSTKAGVPIWVAQLESPPAPKSKLPGIQDPPGFAIGAVTHSKKQAKDSKIQARKAPTAEEMDTLKLKKAWEVALAPVKGLPMTAIMMYMSGNSLQIFSIMMVFMAFKNPLMGLMNTNPAFERFYTPSNSGQMLQVKFVYVAMQILALGVGIWKINQMGLLPTTRSDWLMWEMQREPLEHAVPAL